MCLSKPIPSKLAPECPKWERLWWKEGDVYELSFMDHTLDDLTNLEQSFYQSGFKDGFDHGRVHGLVEGRALGREKGFELWEEVGFYKGFALFWSSTSPAPADEKRRRTVRHAVQLLHLIADFPRHNPSHLVERSQNAEDSLKGFQNSLDMTKIRSKYRLLCASLNLPTRSRESAAAAQNPSSLHYTGTGPGVLVEYEDEAERQHPRFRSGAPEVNRIWKGVEGTES